MNDHKLYLYPAWLRVWHGVNAVCILGLIVTGVSMQYSDIESPLINFNTSVHTHNILGQIVAVSYLIYFIANFRSKNFNQYKMKLKGLIKRLMLQSQYYISGYFKGEPKPFPISKENKFNPLQRVAYVSTMYFFVPLVIVSGVALLFPEIIIQRLFNISGIQLTAIAHSVMGFLISIFLVIHLYVASVGKNPLKNFRSIISGYHEE